MIKSSLKEYNIVDLSKISSQMIEMESTPLNRSAMKLLQGRSNDRIQMLTASSEKIITMALPFATYKSGGKVITNAYVDNIGKISGDRLVCAAPILYSMLDGAYIANRCFDSYSSLTNRDIMVGLMNIYSDMVIGVFNVAIHARADKKLSDLLTYGSRRFLLERMLNIDDEDSVSTISIKGLQNIEQGEYEAAKAKYEELAVNSGTLEDWIKWTRTLSPKCREFTVKLFVEKWIRLYGEFAFFGMDNVEYLIGSILMTLCNANGYSRQFQTLIKNSKSYNKFITAIHSFDD